MKRLSASIIAGLLATAAFVPSVALAQGGRQFRTATRSQTVSCVGTGDYCGASVGIAGGASNRRVTVNLTDTDLKLVGVRVIPGASRGAFSISHASYRMGGSQYRFTLNAVQANPRGARIILLFAAGTPA